MPDQHQYTVTILQDGTPLVTEDDVMLALERVGATDVYVDDVSEEGESPCFILTRYGGARLDSDLPAFKEALQSLDGTSRCTVSIEQDW